MTARGPWLLLLGCGTSLFGDGMFAVALGFAVFAVGGGAIELGAVLLCGLLALLVVIIPAGALADRVDRRTLVVGSDVVRGVVQISTALVVMQDGAAAWHLGVLGFAFGAATAIHQPATMAFIADVVVPGDLDRVNGVLQALRGLGMVVGSATAGVLVVHGSVPLVLALDGATFLACAACLVLVPVVRARAGRGADPLPSRRGQVVEGFAFVAARPWLRAGIATVAGFVLVVYGPLQVLGPLAAHESGGDAAASRWAAVATALAIGLVLGGLVAALRLVARVLPLVRTLLVVGAAGPLTLAWPDRVPLPATLAPFVLLGAAMGLFGADWEAAKQRGVEAGMLARVGAIDWLCSIVCMATGVAVTAGTAALLGSGAMLVAMAVGCVSLAAVAGISPAVHRVARDERAASAR